jgi:hypothetical protein
MALRRDFMEGPFSGVDIGYNNTERDKKKTSTVFVANLRTVQLQPA